MKDLYRHAFDSADKLRLALEALEPAMVRLREIDVDAEPIGLVILPNEERALIVHSLVAGILYVGEALGGMVEVMKAMEKAEGG
jgi:hypothetical protein